MPRRHKLARAIARPKPEQWDLDEPMTLAEAVAVFFPDGPLTLYALRTAGAQGDLAIARCGGKHLTTPRALKDFTRPCLAERPNPRGSGNEPTADGSSSTAAGKAAQAAALTRWRALRKSSPPLSTPDTGRPSAGANAIGSRSQS